MLLRHADLDNIENDGYIFNIPEIKHIGELVLLPKRSLKVSKQTKDSFVQNKLLLVI